VRWAFPVTFPVLPGSSRLPLFGVPGPIGREPGTGWLPGSFPVLSLQTRRPRPNQEDPPRSGGLDDPRAIRLLAAPPRPADTAADRAAVSSMQHCDNTAAN
jgi:hypothetical protein